jgi:hypothetical protein
MWIFGNWYEDNVGRMERLLENGNLIVVVLF